MKDSPVFHLALPILAVPEAERMPLMEYTDRLLSLRSHAAQFERSVQLILFCQEHLKAAWAKKDLDACDQFSAWARCGAHGSSLEVFHFQKTLDRILSIRKNPNVQICSSYFDETASKLLRNRFKERFPNYGEVRNSVAHDAEFADKERPDHEAASVKTPWIDIDSTAYVSGALDLSAMTLGATVDGKFVSVDISPEAATALNNFVAQAVTLFEPLKAALMRVPEGGLLKKHDPNGLQ